MKKVYLRLLPFCFVLYFICYLDRVNVGFAALTMNKDLGLSSYVFGLGAGAFFWGYFLLEVPSNLILERVGARRWIARVMVSWGLVSGAFAFINGPTSFFILRFLLGVAEAGFFPGMILYFTYWFPPSRGSRIVAGFVAAIPVWIGLGAPISTAILELDGVLGVAGWSWQYALCHQRAAAAMELTWCIKSARRAVCRLPERPPRRKSTSFPAFRPFLRIARPSPSISVRLFPIRDLVRQCEHTLCRRLKATA
jgi:MFS family permease